MEKKAKEGDMEKARMICPFTGGKCTQCSLYRGRHHYMRFSTHPHPAKEKTHAKKDGESAKMQKTAKAASPCASSPEGDKI